MTRQYFINIDDRTPNGTRAVMVYSEAEMRDMFDDAQMLVLASGDSVTKGHGVYTDMQAFMDVRT